MIRLRIRAEKHLLPLTTGKEVFSEICGGCCFALFLNYDFDAIKVVYLGDATVGAHLRVDEHAQMK
jgi:hypothetical protein